MNRIEKRILSTVLNIAIQRAEKSPDEVLNLFNSGIIVDLKKAKIRALKIIERGININKKKKN